MYCRFEIGIPKSYTYVEDGEEEDCLLTSKLVTELACMCQIVFALVAQACLVLLWMTSLKQVRSLLLPDA